MTSFVAVASSLMCEHVGVCVCVYAHMYCKYINIWVFKVLNCWGKPLKCDGTSGVSVCTHLVFQLAITPDEIPTRYNPISKSAPLPSHFSNQLLCLLVSMLIVTAAKAAKKPSRKYVRVEELTIYIAEPSDLP